jgi:hypothetical protein
VTAKEYLSQYTNAKQEIEVLTDEVQKLRSLATKITVSFESDGGASGTRNSDKMAICVERIVDTEEQIRQRVQNLVSIRQEVYNTISKVKDSKYRTLLLMRYISDQSFETISVNMNFTYNHIIRELHPKALEEIEKIMNSPT